MHRRVFELGGQGRDFVKRLCAALLLPLSSVLLWRPAVLTPSPVQYRERRIADQVFLCVLGKDRVFTSVAGAGCGAINVGEESCVACILMGHVLVENSCVGSLVAVSIRLCALFTRSFFVAPAGPARFVTANTRNAISPPTPGIREWSGKKTNKVPPRGLQRDKFLGKFCKGGTGGAGLPVQRWVDRTRRYHAA